MATALDFSRAVNLNITTKADRVFTAALTFTRDDSGSVDWTSDSMTFAVYNNFGSTAVMGWSKGSGFSVSTNVVTFNQIPKPIVGDNLSKGVYYYEFYDESNNVAVAYGKFILI